MLEEARMRFKKSFAVVGMKPDVSTEKKRRCTSSGRTIVAGI